jgi:cysteine synthase
MKRSSSCPIRQRRTKKACGALRGEGHTCTRLGNIGACIEECLNTAQKLAEENPRVFIPQQFSNPANPQVHKHHTALEIMEQ